MRTELYHLAAAANLPSILRHGLMSTASLAHRHIADAQAWLRTHRSETVALAAGVQVRDQKPMPPALLARVLRNGLTPADWYALLNGFVFLWADRRRVEWLRHSYRSTPHVMLVFDAPALFADFAAHAFVSPINSGYARRRAVKRDASLFVPYAEWRTSGWPDGRKSQPVEVLFHATLPVRPPYLLRMEH